MTTVHEENNSATKQERKPNKERPAEENEEDEETEGGQGPAREDREGGQDPATRSATLDSLQEVCPPRAQPTTPSLVSSGYCSQAASSTNLSSEDCLSLRSIEVDETPDTEAARQGGAVQVEGGELSLALPRSSSLLSPPDVSLSSISPGDETEHTVTEGCDSATPSTTGQPRLSPEEPPLLLRSASSRLTSQEQDAPGGVLRSCRRSVPEMSCERRESLPALESPCSSPAPEWLRVGESVQLRPSNTSGTVAYVGITEVSAAEKH